MIPWSCEARGVWGVPSSPQLTLILVLGHCEKLWMQWPRRLRWSWVCWNFQLWKLFFWRLITHPSLGQHPDVNLCNFLIPSSCFRLYRLLVTRQVSVDMPSSGEKSSPGPGNAIMTPAMVGLRWHFLLAFSILQVETTFQPKKTYCRYYTNDCIKCISKIFAVNLS